MASCETMDAEPERQTIQDIKKRMKEQRKNRRRKDVLNLSKWHNKSSRSFVKATLRANNTDLAKALEKARADMNELQQCTLDSQKERHLLMCEVSCLRHVNAEYEQRFAAIRESLRSVTTNLLGASSMLSTTLENCLSPVTDRSNHDRISTMSTDDEGYENRKISGPSIYYKKPSLSYVSLKQDIVVEGDSSTTADCDGLKNDIVSEELSHNIRISLPSFLNDSVDGKNTSLIQSNTQDTDVCSVKIQDKDELLAEENQPLESSGGHIKANKKLNFSTSFTESTPTLDDNPPNTRDSHERFEETCVGTSVKIINKSNSFATFFPLTPKGQTKLLKKKKKDSVSELADNPFKTVSKIAHSPQTSTSDVSENQSNVCTENQITKDLRKSETMEDRGLDIQEPVCESNVMLRNSLDILSNNELRCGMLGGFPDKSPDLIDEDMEFTCPLNATIVLGAVQPRSDKAEKVNCKDNVTNASKRIRELTSSSSDERDGHDILKKITDAEQCSQDVSNKKGKKSLKMKHVSSGTESEEKNDLDFKEPTSQKTTLKKMRKSKPKCRVPKKDIKKPGSVFDISLGDTFSKPSPIKLSKEVTAENTTAKPEEKKSKTNQTSRRGTYLVPKAKIPQESTGSELDSLAMSKKKGLLQERKGSSEDEVNDHMVKDIVEERMKEPQLPEKIEKKKSRKSKKSPKAGNKRATYNLKDVSAELKENAAIENNNLAFSGDDVYSDTPSENSKAALKGKTTALSSGKSKRKSINLKNGSRGKSKDSSTEFNNKGSYSKEVISETPSEGAKATVKEKTTTVHSVRMKSINQNSGNEALIDAATEINNKGSCSKEVISETPSENAEVILKEKTTVPHSCKSKKSINRNSGSEIDAAIVINSKGSYSKEVVSETPSEHAKATVKKKTAPHTGKSKKSINQNCGSEKLKDTVIEVNNKGSCRKEVISETPSEHAKATVEEKTTAPHTGKSKKSINQNCGSEKLKDTVIEVNNKGSCRKEVISETPSEHAKATVEEKTTAPHTGKSKKSINQNCGSEKSKENPTVEINEEVSSSEGETSEAPLDIGNEIVKVTTAVSKKLRRGTFNMESKPEKMEGSSAAKMGMETAIDKLMEILDTNDSDDDDDMEPEITVIPDSHIKVTRKKNVRYILDTDDEDCEIKVVSADAKRKSSTKKTSKENTDTDEDDGILKEDVVPVAENKKQIKSGQISVKGTDRGSTIGKIKDKKRKKCILDTDDEDCVVQDDVAPVNENKKKAKSSSKKSNGKENIQGDIVEQKKTAKVKKQDKKKKHKSKAKVCEEDADRVPEVNDKPVTEQEQEKSADVGVEKTRKSRRLTQVKNQKGRKSSDDVVEATAASSIKPEAVEQVNKNNQPSITELEGDVLPRQRGSRRAGVVSYKEPSLNSKLRREDSRKSSPSQNKSRKSKKGTKSQKRETLTNVTNTIDNEGEGY